METIHNAVHDHKLLHALLLVACIAGFTGVSAPAAAEGWYAGVSAGTTEDRNWCDTNLGDCDDRDGAWKFFVGNQLNRFAAFEFGYNDLGKMTETGITAEASGFVVSLVAMIPLGDTVSFTGRVGSFRWETDVNTSSGLSTDKSDESSASLTVGIGANVALSKKISLRAEWEHFDVDDDDLSVMSVGIGYNFGN